MARPFSKAVAIQAFSSDVQMRQFKSCVEVSCIFIFTELSADLMSAGPQPHKVGALLMVEPQVIALQIISKPIVYSLLNTPG